MAKTVDVQMLNPFIQATLDCLTSMAQCQPQRVRVFVKTDPRMHGDVAGIIGMSDGVTASCVVSFPIGLARGIVSRLLGDEPDKLSQEMINDGIGEVANMVAGGAKRIFAQNGVQRFNISTPTVISGGTVQLFNPADTVSIACEFTADPQWSETFLIEVALKPTTK